MASNNTTRILFNFPRSNGAKKFSLAKVSSDYLVNQMLLNHLIATLVKFDSSGRLVPYLAKSWQIENGGRSFSFELHRDRVCSDNTPITAALFKKSLEQSIQEYSENGHVLEFTNIVGLSEFLTKKNPCISGIIADEYSLSFEFSSQPQQFLEFLEMPYFGLWCGTDSPEGFISSGAYVLKNFGDGSAVTLKQNKNWPIFLTNETASETLEFGFIDIDIDVPPTENTIILVSDNLNKKTNWPDHFTLISSPPDVLFSAILSPFLEPFRDINYRKYFASAFLEKIFKSNLFAANEFFPTKSFYPKSGELIFEQKMVSPLEMHRPLRVWLSRRLSIERKKIIKDVISDVISPLKIEIDWDEIDRADREKLRPNENNFYDIRITGVDIGNDFLNSLNRMMFCTTMGVSFPDPCGSMSTLVDKYRDSSIGKIRSGTYAQEFNKILEEDVATIPFARKGCMWLYSKDFDLNFIFSNSVLPSLEFLRRKK